jgi:predicted nuclease of predicted toxin-antitoxin system
VKFVVDAHLPRRLVVRLRECGHDAIHTLDLPHGNRTTDSEINEISVREQRVVMTKDTDFVDSLLIRGEPWRLLLITTGNIRNQLLEELFLANLDRIVEVLETHQYVELSRSAVVLHS